MTTATETRPALNNLKTGDRITVAINGHGFIKGQVTKVSSEGIDIAGPRGSRACLIMHADGTAWGMKGMGTMAPKAGPVESITLVV